MCGVGRGPARVGMTSWGGAGGGQELTGSSPSSSSASGAGRGAASSGSTGSTELTVTLRW